ncbi:Hypothetical Protein FCC1311_100732 [Hondaea fermentalgiana]|uniref:Sulfite exporter TauE/SafE n=1 Tax=Hondaea fermentalgiana TaxID=2315210 RepID=A0A2R5GSN2_9STRA|nr:Hypothetical Protein FCC1311_100732 [Hondaea fermentalgiana]|eukprot:GBG33850.1 Hypothetical Protein FCC1311_100732 [Hondaea fermentalgiana]
MDLLRADKGKGGVVLPEPPKPKTNPDLEKRRAWLIARQQRREYEASVANIRHKRPYEKAQESMSEVRRAMKEVSVGIMMILVCVAVFLALKMTADARGLPPQVGLQWGLFGGSAMLFVEMILFAIRTTRAETESRKERAFLDRQVTNISQLPVIPGGKEAMKKPSRFHELFAFFTYLEVLDVGVTCAEAPLQPSKRVINFAAVAYLEPFTVAGTVVGLHVSAGMSEASLSLVAGGFLLLLSIRTIYKGYSRFCSESRETQADAKRRDLRYGNSHPVDEFDANENLLGPGEVPLHSEKTASVDSRPVFDESIRHQKLPLCCGLRDTVLLAPTLVCVLLVGVLTTLERHHLFHWTGVVVCITAVLGTLAVGLALRQSQNESWTQSKFFLLLPFWSACAGFMSSFIGIGGGMIKAPILYELLGLHPLVVRMTSAFMILLTTGSTVTQNYLYGVMPGQLVVVMILIGVAGGFTGNALAQTRIGHHPSLVILATGTLMFLASMLSFIRFLVN